MLPIGYVGRRGYCLTGLPLVVRAIAHIILCVIGFAT
jgi:hypothetical protein